jgi:hypothetical protein
MSTEGFSAAPVEEEGGTASPMMAEGDFEPDENEGAEMEERRERKWGKLNNTWLSRPGPSAIEG